MALRALQGPTGGGAPVGGTGITNTIPRWTGPTTLGDSVITQSGSFIGIGTASPAAQLHISRAGGTSNAEYIRLTNTTVATNSACGITFFQNNAAVPVNRIEGTVSAAGSYDLVSYAWNGSSTAEVMRLQGNTGNVGIGTASPGAQLHVERAGGSGANTEYLRLRNTTVASGSNVSQSFFVNGNTVATGNISHTWNGTTYDTIFNAWNGSTLAEAGRAVGGSTPVLSVPSGLKLPATPGNADTQTLDCYQESTWIPTLAGFGGTNPTVTATLTRVGRLVTITVQMASTGGAQYSGTLGTTTLTAPAGMTPSIPACTNLVNGAVQNLGNVSAYNDGLIYLPTFALTTSFTLFTITYRV